ncbi:4Fe-4S binding protein [Prevotella histicola]|jgi:membrane bound regulatory protein|uniref:4Fe-4S binding protein n=1 Tax=Prevotella histicola TaxID=470565 RepID=UPI001C5F3A0E|nr:4Fe-4S binding protein [Prevotella histicola]MBS6662133.1 4Fe-4S binding protein [Prevotella histicola]MBW4774335.1 4Fe-4S binding protein [Prevotella histicola]
MVKRLQQIIILLACLSVVAVVAVQRDGKLLGNSVFKGEKTGNTNKIDTLRTLEDGTIIINTSYLAKDIKGFGGAVPLDIYIKNGKILEVKALHNSETPEFFQEASQLLTRWNGKTLDEALKIKVDGVSGATFSSRGIIGNMQAGLRYAAKNAQETSLFDKMDLRTKTLVGLLVVFMAAMIPLFVKDKRYRVFQLLLNFVVLGLWGGTFISWSVIVGYMSGGINVWISLVPIIMLITAFIYPLFGKKNYYCTNVCPFGAVQELAGMVNHKKWKMSKRTAQYLDHFRKILFWVLMILMISGVWFQWMDYELFVAFIFQSATWIVMMMAVVFILLSFFVPRPYCRFVCPMGSFFKLSSTTSVKKLI